MFVLYSRVMYQIILSFVTDSSGEFFDQNIFGKLWKKYPPEGRVKNGIQSLNHTKAKTITNNGFNYVFGEESFDFFSCFTDCAAPNCDPFYKAWLILMPASIDKWSHAP